MRRPNTTGGRDLDEIRVLCSAFLCRLVICIYSNNIKYCKHVHDSHSQNGFRNKVGYDLVGRRSSSTPSLNGSDSLLRARRNPRKHAHRFRSGRSGERSRKFRDTSRVSRFSIEQKRGRKRDGIQKWGPAKGSKDAFSPVRGGPEPTGFRLREISFSGSLVAKIRRRHPNRQKTLSREFLKFFVS